MSDLSKLGFKIAVLYRCGNFEEGHTQLTVYIDMLITALKNNKINETIHVNQKTDFMDFLTDINESFNRNDFISIADIIEYEINYINKKANGVRRPMKKVSNKN